MHSQCTKSPHMTHAFNKSISAGSPQPLHLILSWVGCEEGIDWSDVVFDICFLGGGVGVAFWLDCEEGIDLSDAGFDVCFLGERVGVAFWLDCEDEGLGFANNWATAAEGDFLASGFLMVITGGGAGEETMNGEDWESADIILIKN